MSVYTKFELTGTIAYCGRHNTVCIWQSHSERYVRCFQHSASENSDGIGRTKGKTQGLWFLVIWRSGYSKIEIQPKSKK